jgi:alpha-tubulin suppressor-like RCC1 family protein
VDNAIAISCGDSHSMAFCRDGRLVCWGSNKFGQLNMPDNITPMLKGAVVLM